MVNSKKWEEVDFFDINVGDDIKRVETRGLQTLVIRGTVVFKHNLGYSSGTITLEKNGERGKLFRQETGKPSGVDIYRRIRKDKPFVLPTEFGAIISAEKDGKREHLVWDGEDWGNGIDVLKPERVLSVNYAGYTNPVLVREGIKIG